MGLPSLNDNHQQKEAPMKTETDLLLRQHIASGEIKSTDDLVEMIYPRLSPSAKTKLAKSRLRHEIQNRLGARWLRQNRHSPAMARTLEKMSELDRAKAEVFGRANVAVSLLLAARLVTPEGNKFLGDHTKADLLANSEYHEKCKRGHEDSSSKMRELAASLSSPSSTVADLTDEQIASAWWGE